MNYRIIFTYSNVEDDYSRLIVPSQYTDTKALCKLVELQRVHSNQRHRFVGATGQAREVSWGLPMVRRMRKYWMMDMSCSMKVMTLLQGGCFLEGS
jgi:hypothetical protein